MFKKARCSFKLSILITLSTGTQIQRVLGGNVNSVTSGSAPISVDAVDFLKIALACEVYEGAYSLLPVSLFSNTTHLQGEVFAVVLNDIISWPTIQRSYGLTETAAICTRTMPYDPTSAGTVGPPLPCVEVKLVDVPIMGYTSNDQPGPRGELCSRGLANFTEYYKGDCSYFMSVDGTNSFMACRP